MQKIKIETVVNADIKKVWENWNNSQSITKWAFASYTWECPNAKNDLKVGGKFSTRMSAKDGSEGFDFSGTYTEIVNLNKIKYIMDKDVNEDKNRECEILFIDLGNGTTKIVEEFDPENINSEELQRAGWKAILENFRKFVESL
jgi:uncharacterized protein YndB with AHSA1/START domain